MSIQEHLNKIRNAVYGHEVRESIAKGIETAYDDASENGNANMEVTFARGTHPNLRSRLEEVDNKQQQNTAQLQQTEQELSSQLAQTKNEVERKRKLEDLDSEVLSAIEGGEGTSFTLLSIPQDKSVTPIKTDFLEEVNIGINLQTVNNVVPESYYNETGVLIANHLLFTVIDFISVEQNVKYTHNFYNARCYDVSGNVVGSVANDTTDITFTDGITVKIRPNFKYATTSVADAYIYKIGFEAEKLLVRTENLDFDIVETLENAKTVIENVATIEDVRLKQFPTSKFMHISCDDFYSPLQDLYTNQATYASIFNNPTFAFLKSRHDKYGMVFSAYLWYQNADNTFNLAMVPDKFKQEFIDNSHWLKFGFHGDTPTTSLSSTDATQALTQYNKVITQIMRFTGSYKCVDRMPRLHNYAGNLESITALKSAKGGIVGLLTAEDTRTNYYHTIEQTTRLLNYDRLYDSANNLLFFSTDLRLDVSAGYDDLVARKANSDYANRMNDIVLFLHDPNINFSGFQTRITNCCDFAIENGYRFDFPMNVVMS